MRKGLYFLISGLLLAGFYLACTAPPAYADVLHTTASATRARIATPRYRWHHPVWRWRIHHYGFIGPEINQYHWGDSNHDIPTTTYGGHDQGNTGNNGYNRGHSQDNSANGGNQLSASPHLYGYRRINQYTVGNSNYRNSFVHWGGYDLGNTGNSGHNDGFSQDNSANGGNQILG